MGPQTLAPRGLETALRGRRPKELRVPGWHVSRDPPCAPGRQPSSARKPRRPASALRRQKSEKKQTPGSTGRERESWEGRSRETGPG